MMPMGLREIIQLVLGRVHAASGGDMQERLPQVRAAALDQGDVGQAALTELVAKTRDELEPRRAAADNDDSMRMSFALR
jgi:hypothetical protein